jgi:hypothetical protein
MRLSPQRGESRREFFCRIARWSGLFAVAAGTGAVNFTRKAGGQRCISQGICGGCVRFSNCGLPQALSAKQFLKK